MNYSDPELRDRLAAEYALGTLSGRARRRFERLLSGDRDLRNVVEGWELRLSGLAESVPAVEPPAHVWEEIDRQIARAAAPRRAAVREERRERLWDSLGFWRGATALAAATAAALLFCVAVLRPSVSPERIAALDERLARVEDATRSLASAAGEKAALDERLTSLARRIDVLASRPTHVAVLLDKDQRPMMNADFNSADGRLVLRLNLTPHRDFSVSALEVWAVAPDGTRRSLGMFPSERPGTTTALVLPRDTADVLAKATLAVSLEPRGGSTTGQPSGPVLFTGRLVPSL
ncbi:MAG: anti-sigma factor [Bradyrhizobiaceae bacterium]|nr:anti-sigma factor [Bradyrhizobiaceae bacterium]